MAKNNRSFNNVPKSITWSFKISQTFSPKSALKLALKLFYTPVKFPTTEEEFSYKQALPIHRDVVKGKKITTYLGGHPPFKVLLVHGWSGRASQFMEIGKALQEAQISYVSFTAPAHGSSTQKRTHMLEFAESIEFINRIYGPFDVIVGHSLGGTALMNALTMGVKPSKVAIIGSHATLGSTINDFCNMLQLNSTTQKGIIQHLQKNYHQDIEKYSIERLAGEYDVQALIIHDKKDKQAAYENAVTIHNSFKRSELYTTEGLGHVRILADPEVVKRIIDYIQE